jgi:hypothetical protein
MALSIDIISPIPDSEDVSLSTEFVFRVYDDSSPSIDITNVNVWLGAAPVVLNGAFVNEWTGEIITTTENQDYIFVLIRPIGNPKYDSGAMVHFTAEYEEL